MYKTMPACGDKGTDAVAYAFIIGHAVLGERNKERACLSVCSSILARGTRTGGRIGTGEASFDVPEQRKDDGANRRAIGATWHLPRATA